MAHNHDVIDTDVHYKIDGITRTITNINEAKRELVQGDHNSERFTFEIPRFVDSHDFVECNMVQVHYANLDKLGKVKNADIYIVDDLHIKEDDPDTIVLSWLISSNATQYVGTLNFSIRFACVSGEIVDYAWNTTTFKGILILESLNNSESFIETETDVIASLRNSIIADVEEMLDDFSPASPSNIDLSGLDTNGTIVETYINEDGTTTNRTTTMEFDEEGNPIKITDADGNETVLTW